jgi:putative ABC transport system permease protein
VGYGPPSTPTPARLETLDWRSLDDVLELTIAWDLDEFTLRGGASPEVLQGTWVTPGYVEGFAVRPLLGRGFVPADFDTGRPVVALISHRLWKTRFNGDPAVIRRTFDAYVTDRPNDAETFTNIGVLGPGHWHLNAFTEVLAPLRGLSHPYKVRLREGVPPATASDRITAVVRAGTPGLPAGWRVDLQSTHDGYVQQIRPLLQAVAAATGLVLLIACANVSVLLTVRATRRRREMAVRQALGASTAQITRACAAEPILLTGVATALGLGLAWATIVAIVPTLAHYLGRPAPGGMTAVAIDPETIGLTLAAGVLAIAVCSLVPIWITRRTPVSLALTGGQKGATEGPMQRRARAVLIAAEVAACLTLLVGAGLTIESAARMLRVDMGLDVSDVWVGRFSLSQRASPDDRARGAFYERVAARANELRNVEGVAFTNAWPLQQSPTRDVGAGSSLSTRAGVVGVSPDYFGVLRIPVHAGRGFTAGDRIGSEPVALVSRTLASRLWPSGGAVGQSLRIAPPTDNPGSQPPITVRVVGDIRHAHTDEDLADAYVPIFQRPSSSVFTYLRVSGDPTSAAMDLRRLLASINAEVGLTAPRQLAEILDLQRAGSRFLGYLLVVFAAFAAGLGAGRDLWRDRLLGQAAEARDCRAPGDGRRSRTDHAHAGRPGRDGAGGRSRIGHRRRRGARPGAACAAVRGTTGRPGGDCRHDHRICAVRPAGHRLAGACRVHTRSGDRAEGVTRAWARAHHGLTAAMQNSIFRRARYRHIPSGITSRKNRSPRVPIQKHVLSDWTRSDAEREP